MDLIKYLDQVIYITTLRLIWDKIEFCGQVIKIRMKNPLHSRVLFLEKTINTNHGCETIFLSQTKYIDINILERIISENHKQII